MSDDPSICLICGRVLAVYFIDGDRLAHLHPVDMGPVDHAPVRARYSEAPRQANLKCDFCMASPITHTLVVDGETQIPSATPGMPRSVFSEEWAMCVHCASFVLIDDWLGLRRRAFAEFERLYGELGEQTRMEQRVLYQQLKRGLVCIYQEELA